MYEYWLTYHNFDESNPRLTYSLRDQFYGGQVNQTFRLRRDNCIIHLGVRGVKISQETAQGLARDFITQMKTPIAGGFREA